MHHVIPNLPVRQRGLSPAIPPQMPLAGVGRVTTRHPRGQARLKADRADVAAVALLRRFGSAANLNIHQHWPVLVGGYRHANGEPVFVDVPALTDEALHAVLHKIVTCTMRLLTHPCALIEQPGLI